MTRIIIESALSLLSFIIHFLYSSAVTATATPSPSSSPTKIPSPYKIVIDGGSTGSRLHIFEFKYNPQLNKTHVERRGSKKVNIPLSDFAQPTKTVAVAADDNTNNDDSEASSGLHLLPLFKYASEIIPSHYHATTTISIQATAGMRLVDEKDQHELYNNIYESLLNHDEFVFESFQRSDIDTLSGVWEGLYGAIAVNYLKGIIDVNLHYQESHGTSLIYNNKKRLDDGQCKNNEFTTLGALDLGGASMQLVFLPKSSTTPSSLLSTCPNHSMKEKLPSHEFFSTSYLSYGSDQFRERLWDAWIQDFQKNNKNNREVEEENAIIINNPCSFKGHQTTWKGFILLGTGDAKHCTREVNRLIPHHQDIYDHDSYDEDIYVVGGVEHPPISGEFYAMSLFFFVMDCVRFYTNDEYLIQSWPNPSLHELSNAIESFCAKDWFEEVITSHEINMHQFTRAEILAERCFESVYIVTLLRDGFGFDVHSRDITYSFHVDGSEVEWSLGMAIKSYADDFSFFDLTEEVEPISMRTTMNKNDDRTMNKQPCEENVTDYNCNNDSEENDDDEMINQFFNHETQSSEMSRI
jgi:Golgi apyrase